MPAYCHFKDNNPQNYFDRKVKVLLNVWTWIVSSRNFLWESMRWTCIDFVRSVKNNTNGRSYSSAVTFILKSWILLTVVCEEAVWEERNWNCLFLYAGLRASQSAESRVMYPSASLCTNVSKYTQANKPAPTSVHHCRDTGH